MKILSHTQIDQLGIVAAMACAIHCAALPLVITSLPLIGLGFLANIWVEISMICISMLLGCYSLSKSYPKHQSIKPTILLVFGFVCIAVGHFLIEQLEAFLIPIGGIIIAAAHFTNWKRLKYCSHNHHSDKS